MRRPAPDTAHHWGLPAALLCLLAAIFFTVPRAGAEPAAIPVLPISFAVAHVDGSPVVSDEWLAIQVDRANRVFGAHKVNFRHVETRPLAEKHAKMETRQDRHALGAEMHPKVVNCFIVLSLRDVDDPSRYRRGVHWRPRGYPGKHFVIVSSIAGPHVLAHELGHFFGNRPHSKVPGNIMSYDAGTVPRFFDRKQAKRIHRYARRFLKSGELVPASEWD